MANYANLLAQIAANIYSNNNQDITGDGLQAQLNAMVASLGAGYQFMGVAHPADTPSGYADLRAFWIAGEAGTYTNFGGLVVNDNEFALLLYATSWQKKAILPLSAALDKKVDIVLGTNLVDSSKISQGVISWGTGTIQTSYPGYNVSDFIPVSSANPKIIANAYYASGAWSGGNVYDQNKNLIRTLGATDTYVYQAGDAYVRFSFRASMGDPHANYGNTLLPYEPYDQLATKVSPAQLAEALLAKLDKIESVNLINPDSILTSKYLSPGGNISDATSPNFSVCEDYIPVNGDDIISNCYPGVQNVIAGIAVYNASKNFLRSITSDAKQYTYQAGDAYVRFGFHTSNGSPYAYRGTTDYGYVPYSEVPGMFEIYMALAGTLQPLTPAGIPNYIYRVYNSVKTDRNYAVKLQLSHLLDGGAFVDSPIYFSNGAREFFFTPESVAQKSENNITINIAPKGEYSNASISTKIRTANSAYSKNSKPRVLVIGDSVTSGYGSGSNKTPSWLPNQYWAVSKMLFEMDKIDGGDNAGEYNALFLGKNTDGSFTIDYDGVSRQVRAMAEGKGGAALQELFAATWGDGGGTANPFYDSINDTFSIAEYIKKYRTMDDSGVRLVSQASNPAGASVIGSDGATYQIGTAITSQSLLASVDVCTPSHIIINLVHNTTLANYQAYIGQVINIIQNEVPGAKIILMVIDEAGTYFPNDYPNYPRSAILMGGLHSKNLSIYNYIHSSIENEANGIYLLGANFIQPTAQGYPTIEYQSADSIGKADKTLPVKIENPNVAGAEYHPNNYAHAALGYALYAMLKYLIS